MSVIPTNPSVRATAAPLAAKPKPEPKDPPKTDRPALDKPAPAKESSETIFLQLARQAEVRDLNDMPNTLKRREEAVRRMREVASEEQEKAVRDIRGMLDANGLEDAKISVDDRLWITNGMVVTVSGLPGGMTPPAGEEEPAKLISTLENLASVEDAAFLKDLKGVIKSPTVTTQDAAESGRRTKLPWNLTQINADDAWKAGITGEGVTVANVDTGVDVKHPALWSKYKGYSREGFGQEKTYLDATKPSPKLGDKPVEPKDYNGHGTHTMGSVVGDDGQGKPVGVAPDAKFIAAAGLGEQGGEVLGLLKAMQFVTAPTDSWGQIDAKAGADVVNHSWGGEGPDTTFTAALRNMAAAGVVNVFAAGNAGETSKNQNLGDPGMWQDVVTVGAVNKHKEVASFSSKGPSPVTDEFKPFVVAPGEGVESTLPGGSYGTYSGTSMAAPHVTGALALVDQALAERKQPKLDLDDAKFVLQHMTKDIGPKGPDDASGHGLVDLSKMKAAVDALVKTRAAS
jgi:subtilisin family serine protease